MDLPYGPMHYWVVVYHYQQDGKSYRSNGRMRVVAANIEQAIASVKQKCADKPKLTIFSCAHHGGVDYIDDEVIKVCHDLA